MENLACSNHSTRCKLHSCTVVSTSTRCLTLDVKQYIVLYMHCFVCFVVRNIDTSNVGPFPFEPNVRCTAHGPSLARLRYKSQKKFQGVTWLQRAWKLNHSYHIYSNRSHTPNSRHPQIVAALAATPGAH